MRTACICILACLVMCGCATSYKAKGFTGGYSETRLSENVFKVSFKGNGYTSMERATDYCLLRCAELAVRNGYKFFAVVDESQHSKKGSYTTPTTTYGTATVSGNTASGTSTTYGGQTFIISKPRATNTIFCYKTNEGQATLFDAYYVRASIRGKYRIK
jgi:hypothetical protein